ncbi:hypothetical protein [uncultured Flavobacterium sp.]|uniref:hypothetical protein n=1 Tax=uncultured Flavobacterium sp. TaxID=165435 RepID=UPI0030CA154D
MKQSFLLVVLSLFFYVQCSFSQEFTKNSEKYSAHNKGKFYFYWGGNRETFSTSDIRFKGSDYDFTIYDVVAHDKPKGWHIDYINPARMTIPQTNFRMGYFINDHYNISLGIDHMKYVMLQNKTVTYSGNYPNAESYNENPNGNQLTLDESFLTFEHTDGLNYINTEITRVDDFSHVLKLPNIDKFQINTLGGIGIGLLFPKTNATVLSKERHDDFHVSGYGASAKVGLNFTFYKHFFIQTELKGGFINMNDIKTTALNEDTAEQQFWFLQRIIAFGGIFRL